MIDLLDEDPNVAAARVALLAVRASLARTGPPPENRFRIFHIRRTLGPETAALEMARMPRPITLTGTVRDGVIVITRAEDAAWMHVTRPTRLARREARLRPRDPRLPVCCIGAGESLLVTIEAARAAARNYPIALRGGYTASRPAFYLGDDPRIARQAYEAGAVRILRFHFPTDVPSPRAAGDVIVLPGARRRGGFRVLEHARGEGPCALCGVPVTGWRETATWTEPWRVRRLCSACITARIAPLALAKARQTGEWLAALSSSQVRELEQEIAGDLDRMEATFRRLPMPPELRELLDRWRGRLTA